MKRDKPWKKILKSLCMAHATQGSLSPYQHLRALSILELLLIWGCDWRNIGKWVEIKHIVRKQHETFTSFSQGFFFKCKPCHLWDRMLHVGCWKLIFSHIELDFWISSSISYNYSSKWENSRGCAFSEISGSEFLFRMSSAATNREGLGAQFLDLPAACVAPVRKASGFFTAYWNSES